MRPSFKFMIKPFLPERLTRLHELVKNLHWSWDHETVELFRRLDNRLWEESYHNPVRMLGMLDQERLDKLASDEAFLAHYDRVCERLDTYLIGEAWYQTAASSDNPLVIGYFSAEFGLTECLPTYSGGLGVLAGDHLKAASDLGIPLVGVGLLYQEGYFRQYLNADGWQQEVYPDNDFHNMPLEMERDENGDPIRISVSYPQGEVQARIWRVKVGRVPLFLLDTNLEENRYEDRTITARLYGGDQEMRIRQEILLGIGGIRALHAVGLDPTVCHINEGHAAFLGLERARVLMKNHGLSFDEAREAVAAGQVFTTHTPVAAGNDVFPCDLVTRYFSQTAEELGLTMEEFLGLGRQVPSDTHENFCMTVMALRLASCANGVSRLHGTVSRAMWKNIWPGVPEAEIPIDHITNGIHARSWISRDMAALYDRYLGPRWLEDPDDTSLWERVNQIPSSELWRTHERRRDRLVTFARRRLVRQLERQGAPASELAAAREALDPSVLTLGFARRFASYKRATLLLRDPERFARIIGNKDRPVQLIFAGKAHPQDNGGKELIRQIAHLIRQPPFKGRIVFIEDYDICVARYMVQGVDVWLNTPRLPQEASGTSGMKAAANGGLNLSILDGWWAEGYHQGCGWALGGGEEYKDTEYQDEVESNDAYNILEDDLVPLFYDRSRDRLPIEWIKMMKNSIRTLTPFFNTNRMVYDYVVKFYIPSADRACRLVENGAARGKELSAWKRRIRESWHHISIESFEPIANGALYVGSELQVRATINLASLKPDDVLVEVYYGPLDPSTNIAAGQTVKMKCDEFLSEDKAVFTGKVPCSTSGEQGYAIRVMPSHTDQVHPYEPGLITWR